MINFWTQDLEVFLTLISLWIRARPKLEISAQFCSSSNLTPDMIVISYHFTTKDINPSWSCKFKTCFVLKTALFRTVYCFSGVANFSHFLIQKLFLFQVFTLHYNIRLKYIWKVFHDWVVTGELYWVSKNVGSVSDVKSGFSKDKWFKISLSKRRKRKSHYWLYILLAFLCERRLQKEVFSSVFALKMHLWEIEGKAFIYYNSSTLILTR